MNVRASAVVALASLVCASCISAPVLVEVPTLPVARLLDELPPGARALSVEGDGRELRGIYVPSHADAPLVLHLHGSGQSTAQTMPPQTMLYRDLAELGFASLALDYGGVGLSPGERDAERLPDDVRVMWAAALELAGGREERVIVRGVSLGALGAGWLLREGAKPAAIVLHAPVRGETVIPKVAHRRFLVPGALIAALLFAPLTDVDLCAELERCDVPRIVHSSRNEDFLWPRDLELLREASASHGGRFVEGELEHVITASLAAWLRADEIEFLLSLGFRPPDAAADRERAWSELSDEARAALSAAPDALERWRALRSVDRASAPDQLAAAAVRASRSVDAIRWSRLMRDAKWDGLNFEGCLRALDIEHGPTALSLDEIELYCIAFSWVRSMLRAGRGEANEWFRAFERGDSADVLNRARIEAELDPTPASAPRFFVDFQSGWLGRSRMEIGFDRQWERWTAEGVAADELVCAAIRLTLWGFGTPNAPSRSPRGAPAVDVWEDRRWQTIAPGKKAAALDDAAIAERPR